MNEINRITELKTRLADLPEYVINQMYEHLVEYDKDNEEDEEIKIDTCPKCGKEHPRLVKGGKTKAGKQLLLCKECGRKFVVDYYEVTFHSRLSKEQWNQAIKSTVMGDSVYVTAEKCSVCIETAFRMRHKIMTLFEKNEDSVMVEEAVELDETYVLESHKGTRVDNPRHRGEAASKRGISNEQVCLLTAVQRDGGSFLRSYNMGRPTSEDIMNLADHIKETTYIWTDNHSSYNKLVEKLNSKRVILSSHEDYDSVNHLNNVNSFHSRIQGWYRHMRGVATKYINRYAALYNVRHLLRDMSGTESLLKAKKLIKSLGNFATLNWDELDNSRLFYGRVTAA
jgi:transposase-like protein